MADRHHDRAAIMAELRRRFGADFDKLDDRLATAAAEHREAALAELARRAELADTDPNVLFARALTGLADAITALTQRSGPIAKTVERDAAGNIVRIIETPQ